jgi:hypothetical protein
MRLRFPLLDQIGPPAFSRNTVVNEIQRVRIHTKGCQAPTELIRPHSFSLGVRHMRETNMSKLVLLAAVALACGAAGCQSRITHPQSVTVQGCIARASGGYMLTEHSGRKYVLSGQSELLNQQVGHEALIRGNLLQSNQSAGAPPSANHGTESRIDVAAVQSVSQKCE